MHKPWLVQYPAGVPAEIDTGEFASLKDVLASSCARFADLPAHNSMGTVMTYRKLDEASRFPRPTSARSCGESCATTAANSVTTRISRR